MDRFAHRHFPAAPLVACLSLLPSHTHVSLFSLFASPCLARPVVCFQRRHRCPLPSAQGNCFIRFVSAISCFNCDDSCKTCATGAVLCCPPAQPAEPPPPPRPPVSSGDFRSWEEQHPRKTTASAETARRNDAPGTGATILQQQRINRLLFV